MSRKQSGATLRPFVPADIPAIVPIGNAHFPDEPTTVEEQEYEEQHRDPALPFRQLVAELDGEIVGYGNCGIPFAGLKRYGLWIMVAPAHLRQGIGRQLAADLLAWARAAQQPLVRGFCREDRPASRSFLESLGFQIIGKRFESVLNLDTFRETDFAVAFDRVAAAGITLTQFDTETSPDAVEQLYAIARPLLESVPFPGGDVFSVPFDEWRRQTFEHPGASPANTVIAKRGDAYVGYTSIWTPPQGPATTIMTGVLPAERRHGVALAMKLLSFRIARERGYHEIRTQNDTANPGILRLNEQLGYSALAGHLVWEKPLDAA